MIPRFVQSGTCAVSSSNINSCPIYSYRYILALCLHQPARTHVRFIARHGELSHEVHAGLHVNEDSSAGPRSHLDPLVQVSREGGVFFKGQTSLWRAGKVASGIHQVRACKTSENVRSLTLKKQQAGVRARLTGEEEPNLGLSDSKSRPNRTRLVLAPPPPPPRGWQFNFDVSFRHAII